MDPLHILTSGMLCMLISVVLMIRGWRLNRSKPLMTLSMIPIFIGLIIGTLSQGFNDQFYAKISFYMIVFIILAIGGFLYLTGSQILRFSLF